LWGFISKVAIKLLYHRAKKIVSVSQEAADDLVEHFGVTREKIQVLYNPIDIGKIQKLAEEPTDETVFDGHVIITVGRLTKQKGHIHLLSAFREVKKAIPEAKLIVIGEGELRSELEGQKDVHLLGWQENPYKFLRRANVFVLSSLWEGLPTVLLEALACELPIVSFDCKSGPREILADGKYGVLVPEKDEHKLAQEIVNILNDKDKQAEWGEKAKERAQDFRMDFIMNKWLVLFESLNGTNTERRSITIGR